MTVTVSDWRETTIGGIVEFLDYRRVPLSGQERQKRQGSYPYYGASGIIDHIDDYIFDGKFLLVAEDGENLNSRKLPIAFFASGKFWVNNHAHIIQALKDEADDYFIKAWFDQANISGYITGAAQPKLSQENLRRIQIKLPPLLIQKKIATILSAYDDLIDNNNRRIKILEAMAKLIYQEWFVNLRFPGHENIRMIDSPLGKIPEGWYINTVNDFVNIKSGYAFNSQTFDRDGMFRLITIKNVKDGIFIPDCENRINELPANLPEYCHLKTGDILLSLTGNVGRACLVYGNGYLLNQRVAKLEPKDGIGKAFVYFTFRRDEFKQRLEMVSTGVAQQNLSPIQMGKMEFVLPAATLLNDYSDKFDAIVNQISSLNLSNLNLRNTRELLLPRLISGELDVSELNIDISGEAA